MSFFKYLKQKTRIPENKIPFYIQWISAWKAHIAGCPSSDRLFETFALSLKTRYSPWKVQKAIHAVRQYMHYQELIKFKEKDTKMIPE